MYMVSEEELKLRREMAVVAEEILDKIKKRLRSIEEHEIQSFLEEAHISLWAEIVLILMRIHPEYKEGVKN